MALTNAEKQRNYRNRKKDDIEFRLKENKRKRESNKVAKLYQTAEEREIKRQQALERVRRHRQKRKDFAAGSHFKTIEEREEALARVRDSLPKDLKKRNEILSILCRTTVSTQKRNRLNADKRRVPPAIRKAIVKFYLSDKVSIVSSETKLKLFPKDKADYEARCLTVTLREAYDLFCGDNPNIKIGLSKFRELRPTNVMLMRRNEQKECKSELKTEDFEEVFLLESMY